MLSGRDLRSTQRLTYVHLPLTYFGMNAGMHGTIAMTELICPFARTQPLDRASTLPHYCVQTFHQVIPIEVFEIWIHARYRIGQLYN